ncbi:uncharacterized protein F5891DRAFT_984830 [Suillus fuscotomentosus]|uniref:Uncharacterized protein n=1 Tax=Suillus fuscotomentosus TaxID=1912939 RepID=A0AAD4HFV9_9AGAM|nr:uncharacterized protein F5891DRAFT_984830 [Suillus fuscotomentosus]KAG1894671.1 hypothetical protein F5891DRAFT_984830 [Suillus fuscotomentosus]
MKTSNSHNAQAVLVLSKWLQRETSKLEVITRIVISVDKLVWGLNTTNINVPKYHLTEPPLRPAMLCDHDDLVVVMNLVANDEHIGLIGPAGMGNNSLMNAILNELSWSPAVLLKKWDNQYTKVLDQYYGSACIELMAYNTWSRGDCICV